MASSDLLPSSPVRRPGQRPPPDLDPNEGKRFRPLTDRNEPVAPTPPTELEIDLLEKLACMHEQHAGVLRAVASGFSAREIASLLSLTRSQVVRRLREGRSRLRTLLGPGMFPVHAPLQAPQGLPIQSRAEPRAS